MIGPVARAAPQPRLAAAPVPADNGPASLRLLLSPKKLGWEYWLCLVWLFYEFGRPSHPLGVPLIISLTLFWGWANRKDKQWASYSPWWFVVLGVMLLDIVLATNTYAAFWTARDMTIRFLCICLPLQSLATSVPKVRLWLYTYLGTAFYIGSFAALNGGHGPSGAGGGQDENYVATLMVMAIGIAYFVFQVEKRGVLKIFLATVMVTSVAAIALADNASRGGFVALIAVGGYGFMRSKRKGVALGILAVVGIALLALAGPAFWKEIGTSTQYDEGTSDLRLEIWKAGLRMWAGNPLFGVGGGNFRWRIQDFQSEEQIEHFGRSLGGSIIAHSLPVEMLAEVGSIGSIATIILVWSTWRALGRVSRAGRNRKQPPDPRVVELGCYADAIRAAFLAVLVSGIFLSLFHYSHLWLLIALGSACPFILRHLQEQTGGTTAPAPQVGRRSVQGQTPGMILPGALRTGSRGS